MAFSLPLICGRANYATAPISAELLTTGLQESRSLPTERFSCQASLTQKTGQMSGFCPSVRWAQLTVLLSDSIQQGKRSLSAFASAVQETKALPVFLSVCMEISTSVYPQ